MLWQLLGTRSLGRSQTVPARAGFPPIISRMAPPAGETGNLLSARAPATLLPRPVDGSLLISSSPDPGQREAGSGQLLPWAQVSASRSSMGSTSRIVHLFIRTAFLPPASVPCSIPRPSSPSLCEWGTLSLLEPQFPHLLRWRAVVNRTMCLFLELREESKPTGDCNTPA